MIVERLRPFACALALGGVGKAGGSGSRGLANRCSAFRSIAVICMALSFLSLECIAAVVSTRPFFAEVRGVWLGDHAAVEWMMSEETGSAAYRVWRVSPAGDTLIDEEWENVDILGRKPGTYEVIDPLSVEGDSIEIMIEELTVGGETRFWGPWEVRFDSRKVFPRELETARQTRQKYPVDVLSPLPPGPAVKVPVLQHGLYSVSYESIATGLGMDVSNVASLATQALLNVSHEGVSVAYTVGHEEEAIWFYGWPITNRYTRTQYFWIEPGEGIHIQEIGPDPIPVESNLTHTTTMRFKEDVWIPLDRFSSLPDDFYYSRRFAGNHPSWGEKTFELDLYGYAGGDVHWILGLEGVTSSAMSPDHEAVFFVNDVELEVIQFDGFSTIAPELLLSATNVWPASNQFRIEANLLPGRPYSHFLLKHFDLVYQRYYEPSPYPLLAGHGGNERISADRFDDPIVLDITDPYAAVRIANSAGGIPEGWSWLSPPESFWLFQERDSIEVLEAQSAGHGEWMRSNSNQVDYLVITPRQFEAPANDLASYRASQGLRTAVAFYEDICDEFAYGLNTPEAIQTLIQYAHLEWDAPPQLILLAGWGHFDYLGGQSSAINHLPPLLGVELRGLLRPADGLFADLTGDQVPDIAVGRLPVQTVSQFEDYINKLQVYEAAGLQNSHLTASFFADDEDDGGNFEATNQALSHIAEARYSVLSSVLVPPHIHPMRTNMIHTLREGRGIFHYTGHGSFQQLADENVLNNNDISAMPSHPPVPLVVSLTCYVGRFDDFSTQSLSEALVLKPAGGALAVYAPSGNSLNAYGQEFGEAFYEHHALGNYDTLGLALVAAGQTMGPPTRPLEAVSRRTYMLLGCPALKLRGADGGDVPAAINQFALWRWERFSAIELQNPAISSADSVPLGQEWNNLLAYAFGDHPPRIDITVDAAEMETVSIEWIQRAGASDFSTMLNGKDDLQDEWHRMDDATNVLVNPIGNGLSEMKALFSADTQRRYFRLEIIPQ